MYWIVGLVNRVKNKHGELTDDEKELLHLYDRLMEIRKKLQ